MTGGKMRLKAASAPVKNGKNGPSSLAPLAAADTS